VFAAGLVLGLGGLIVSTARRSKLQNSGTRDACLLFTASAVLILIPAAAFASFDWRYHLPQLSLIPVAAMLGVHAASRRLSSASQPDRRHPEARPEQDRTA
jgi:hypothetical protein